MRKIKPIYMVIAALVLLTAAAAAVHFATRAQVPEGSIRVEWGGKEAHIALEELELTAVHGTIRNGKGEELAVDGQGALLSSLLDKLGITGYEQVAVTAGDSYSAVVTADEIVRPDKVYLLVREDGVRLVVFGDENSRRNVSGVEILTVS